MIFDAVFLRRPTSKDARRLVEACFRRWDVEDEFRAAKQLLDLENTRLLTRTSLVRMVDLSILPTGLLALYDATHPRSATWVAQQAPIVDPVPPYPAYRLIAAARTRLVPAVRLIC